MAHASNEPRPPGRRRRQYHIRRGLWNLVAAFVRPDDWRTLSIGVFLTCAGVGGVVNAQGLWEGVLLVAVGLVGLYYTCASVIAMAER